MISTISNEPLSASYTTEYVQEFAMTAVHVPVLGHWPTHPQEEVTISRDRIWIDGCFDFAHHGTFTMTSPTSDRHNRLNMTGHAGAMLQARRLGKELFVGVHSDEEILDNKGPTVMTLKERFVPLEILSKGKLKPSR